MSKFNSFQQQAQQAHFQQAQAPFQQQAPIDIEAFQAYRDQQDAAFIQLAAL